MPIAKILLNLLLEKIKKKGIRLQNPINIKQSFNIKNSLFRK